MCVCVHVCVRACVCRINKKQKQIKTRGLQRYTPCTILGVSKLIVQSLNACVPVYTIIIKTLDSTNGNADHQSVAMAEFLETHRKGDALRREQIL